MVIEEERYIMELDEAALGTFGLASDEVVRGLRHLAHTDVTVLAEGALLYLETDSKWSPSVEPKATAAIEERGDDYVAGELWIADDDDREGCVGWAVIW